MSNDLVSRDVLHEEHASAPNAAAIALVAITLVVVELTTDFALNGWGIVASPFLLIVAATVWSPARYNSIRLTGEQLVVGRATYTPGDFDREFGVRAIDALTQEERSLVDSPMPIPRDASVQVAGGGFGRPFGSGVVVLGLVGSGKKLALTSRRTDELGRLLGNWLLHDSVDG
ncbi:MAG: hypothetical protein OEU32_15705 [Acidimicrobiia bacterium]|nr:hypothetical protein [Acidimicrobiia bacterium]